MAKDVQEIERAVPERAPDDEWKGLVVKLLKEPKWKTRDANMPMLFNPMDVAREWEIKFGGGTERRMKHFAFETRPGSLNKFVGVTVPEHRPKAWLIYFRHTAKQKDFEGDLLALGAGDYLIGRFQASPQRCRPPRCCASHRSAGWRKDGARD